MSKRLLGAVLLLGLGVNTAWAQDAFLPVFFSPIDYLSRTIPLAVPEGTTLQVALTDEVRIKKVGQPIQGRLVEAVYAFDQEVLPVGSEVRGRITSLKGASSAQRVLYGLNADFSPPRGVEVTFEEIVLPDGRVIPIQTLVTPGSGQPLQLVTTVDNNKKSAAKDLATQKMKEAVQEAKQKWSEAMAQVKQPGKRRRVGRYALSRLPVHPQYLDAGTVYFAELQTPLDFGSKLHFPRPVSAESSPPLQPARACPVGHAARFRHGQERRSRRGGGHPAGFSCRPVALSPGDAPEGLRPAGPVGPPFRAQWAVAHTLPRRGSPRGHGADVRHQS